MDDVVEARSFLDAVGLANTKIFAKLESRQSLLNFKGILNEADGIIISRWARRGQGRAAGQRRAAGGRRRCAAREGGAQVCVLPIMQSAAARLPSASLLCAALVRLPVLLLAALAHAHSGAAPLCCRAAAAAPCCQRQPGPGLPA